MEICHLKDAPSIDPSVGSVGEDVELIGTGDGTAGVSGGGGEGSPEHGPTWAVVHRHGGTQRMTRNRQVRVGGFAWSTVPTRLYIAEDSELVIHDVVHDVRQSICPVHSIRPVEHHGDWFNWDEQSRLRNTTSVIDTLGALKGDYHGFRDIILTYRPLLTNSLLGKPVARGHIASGNVVAVPSRGGQVLLFDVRAQSVGCVIDVAGAGLGMPCCTWSPNGQMLATCAPGQKQIALWDVRNASVPVVTVPIPYPGSSVLQMPSGSLMRTNHIERKQVDAHMMSISGEPPISSMEWILMGKRGGDGAPPCESAVVCTQEYFGRVLVLPIARGDRVAQLGDTGAAGVRRRATEGRQLMSAIRSVWFDDVLDYNVMYNMTLGEAIEEESHLRWISMTLGTRSRPSADLRVAELSTGTLNLDAILLGDGAVNGKIVPRNEDENLASLEDGKEEVRPAGASAPLPVRVHQGRALMATKGSESHGQLSRTTAAAPVAPSQKLRRGRIAAPLVKYMSIPVDDALCSMYALVPMMSGADQLVGICRMDTSIPRMEHVSRDVASSRHTHWGIRRRWSNHLSLS